MGPKRLSDVLVGLPIIMVCFLCQFNVLGVYAQMTDPSPEGTYYVMSRALLSAAVLFFCFGVAGYLFAYDQTSDNILNNFMSNEPGIGLLIARVGLMVTLMCQLPMIMLPCRASLFSLLWPEQADSVRGEDDFYVTCGLPVKETYMRWGATYVLLCGSLVVAVNVRSVASIWSIVGSTIALTIAFLLPAAAYVSVWRQLGEDRRVDRMVVGAHALLCVSVVLIVVCTYQVLFGN